MAAAAGVRLPTARTIRTPSLRENNLIVNASRFVVGHTLFSRACATTASTMARSGRRPTGHPRAASSPRPGGGANSPLSSVLLPTAFRSTVTGGWRARWPRTRASSRATCSCVASWPLRWPDVRTEGRRRIKGAPDPRENPAEGGVNVRGGVVVHTCPFVAPSSR